MRSSRRWTEDELAAVMRGRQPIPGKKRPKYRNVKTVVNGITFDSKAEANRYGVLRIMECGKEIVDLEVHPRFSLDVNGVHIGRYTGDFQYRVRRTGERVVEDVKSKPTRTQAYRLRNRLMLAIHGIEIREVS